MEGAGGGSLRPEAGNPSRAGVHVGSGTNLPTAEPPAHLLLSTSGAGAAFPSFYQYRIPTLSTLWALEVAEGRACQGLAVREKQAPSVAQAGSGRAQPTELREGRTCSGHWLAQSPSFLGVLPREGRTEKPCLLRQLQLVLLSTGAASPSCKYLSLGFSPGCRRWHLQQWLSVPEPGGQSLGLPQCICGQRGRERLAARGHGKGRNTGSRNCLRESRGEPGRGGGKGCCRPLGPFSPAFPDPPGL